VAEPASDQYSDQEFFSIKSKERGRRLETTNEIKIDSEKNRQKMRRLAEYRMPFGKYKNVRLVDLPEPYVVWFSQKGFPAGELGEMLSIVHEIKVNGLEHLFKKSLTE
jgi:uncharacterized protein